MKTKQCYEEHIACHGDTCNKEMKHTPTPWELVRTKERLEIRLLAEPGFCYAFSKKDEANAAFIIRAVNSHEALLEAAKHLRDCYGYKLGATNCGLCENSLKAIAQAEGK